MEKVSIIIPVHNGEKWIDCCFKSILKQKLTCVIEVSVFNDSSTDETQEKLNCWKSIFAENGFEYIVGVGTDGPKGVGYAKNKAVRQSTGEFLCFQDIDDVMMDNRIDEQLKTARNNQNCIIGSKFVREPLDSTIRFTKWANNLTPTQLNTQIYTSHGPTIVMPTWFCSRNVFDNVGSFSEDGHGTPEDLIFFYKHLELGGLISRVDEELVVYRYHPDATTFSIHENTIFKVRLDYLIRHVLNKWDSFVIWNAGKQGRKFYRALPQKFQDKVSSFCDVDTKKINKGVYIYEECDIIPKPRVPIKHFRECKPPFVVCMKLDLTNGAFEANLETLNVTEGKDYVLFT